MKVILISHHKSKKEEMSEFSVLNGAILHADGLSLLGENTILRCRFHLEKSDGR
jgi:hypothetical protein